MILYHITPKRNLDKILTEGFFPAKGKGISQGRKIYKNHLFFTDNPKHIIETQLTYKWIQKHDPFIIEINHYEEDKIEPMVIDTILRPHEYVTKISIPVERIKMYYDLKCVYDINKLDKIQNTAWLEEFKNEQE